METRRKLPREINLPNALTILRLVLTPLVVVLILNDALVVALAVFIVAAGTDYLDGLIARAYGLQTRFGAFLDPIADKVLIFAMLALLPWLNTVPVWFSAAIIARELCLGGGVLFLHATGRHVVIDPSRMSKYATTGEFLAIGLGIVAVGGDTGIREYLAAAMLGTVVLVAVSFVDYGWRFVVALRGARAAVG
ncbi:MAG: CDP-alcohol phosphatidyltransferase family protein [Deltaproteobacteria bacterium]|nr:CDP-alcohol phosphatidyltransferase family protein [Deltaproteobacteria bacterium]